MNVTTFFWILLAFYTLYLTVEIFLNILNLNNLKKHKNEIPELFKATITAEEYQKSIAYTKSKTYLAISHLVYQSIILWSFAGCGIFASMDLWLFNLVERPFISAILYPFAIGFLFYLTNLPWAIYQQFVTEKRFGFSKITVKTFVSDQVKTMAVALIMGLPLVALLLWLIDISGPYWWIWGWSSFMLFQLLTTALFPILIVPIFYKMLPLKESELKDRLMILAKQLQFKTAGIFTIDGSKRSSHSNAFFAGLGKAKRIVLFDTLLNQLSTKEITSVIAHEMGHNVKKHIQRSFILSALVTLLGFWLLSVCLNWPEFYTTFQIESPSMHVGLILFVLFASVFTFPLTPLFNALSRKHEYEADAFSVQLLKDRESMTSSLLKLSKENLSNLTPHRWYSFFHYSHPTTLERAKAIKSLKFNN